MSSTVKCRYVSIYRCCRAIVLYVVNYGKEIREYRMSKKKKSVWLTYAWDDNADGDVDFVANELVKSGLDIKLDRWNLSAGRRLWEQIESFICDSEKSDSWVLYATQTSLSSESCKEEFAYALDRALKTRGSTFPIIGLFPSTVDDGLIPAGIRTRLFVSLTDPDWKERIKASVEERESVIQGPPIEPYDINVHLIQDEEPKTFAIEMRPRAGSWSPFMAAIPVAEKDILLYPPLRPGPKDQPQVVIKYTGSLSWNHGESLNGRYWVEKVNIEVTPTQSCYLFCKRLPSILVFGVHNGQPRYQVSF